VWNQPEGSVHGLATDGEQADGGKADIAKSMHGFGSGVLEIAPAFRGDAYRVIYVLKLADEIWVVHAF